MNSWADPVRRAELVKALKRAAWAPLAEVFRDPDDLDQEELVILVEALKVLERYKWENADYTDALRMTVYRALKALPDEERPNHSNMSWREIGLTLYGFTNRDAARQIDKPTAFDRRRQVVLDSAPHISESTFKRVLEKFYSRFADEFASFKPSVTVHEQPDEQGVTATHLIYREKYVSAITSLVDDGRMVVCIWGEPGTGKTVLAQQGGIASQRGPALLLRPSDDKVLHGDLIAALIAEGEQPSSWSEAYCRHAFKQKLAGSPRSSVVIIDDVASEATLESLVPPIPKIPVIVTSRVRLKSQGMECVELHDFTDTEAFSFVKERLNQVDEQDARALASLLGNRPLALSHAVDFLNETPDITTYDLVEELKKSVAFGVDIAARAQGGAESLTALYRSVLAFVDQDQLASTVLDAFLALAGHTGYVPRELHYVFVRNRFGDLAGSRVGFTAGLRVLERIGLVRDEAAIPFASAVPVLTGQRPWRFMHPFTCQILRELRWARLLQLEDDFVAFLVEQQRAGSISEQNADLTKGMEWVKLYGLELSVARNVLPGWEYLLCVDTHTWVATRANCKPGQSRTIRYQFDPSGAYRVDYATGSRVILTSSEARYLQRAVTIYVEKAELAIRSSAVVSSQSQNVSPFEAACKFAVEADTLAHRGELALATDKLDGSLEYLRQCCDRQEGLSWLIYGLMVKHYIGLMRGADQTELDGLLHEIESAWRARPPEVQDPATEAGVLRARSQHMAATLARQSWAYVSSDSVPQELRAEARQCLEIGERANSVFSVDRTRLPLDRDRARLIARDSTGVDILDSVLYDYRNYPFMWDRLRRAPGDTFLVGYHRVLLGMKAALVQRELHWRPISEQYRLAKALADRMADWYESAYLYAEFLALTSVLVVLNGERGTPALNATHREYQRLGRTDRWEYLIEAVESLPDDYSRFAYHFSYLLTW